MSDNWISGSRGTRVSLLCFFLVLVLLLLPLHLLDDQRLLEHLRQPKHLLLLEPSPNELQAYWSAVLYLSIVYCQGSHELVDWVALARWH